MGSFGDDTPEKTTVVCPVCQTRLYAEAADQETEIVCHDCLAMVWVPAREPVTTPSSKKNDDADLRTYQIATETEADERRRPVSSESEFVKITCPSCQAQLHPDLKEKARHVTCPDCLEIIDVPSRRDARTKRQSRKKKRPKQDVGTDAVPTVAEPAKNVDQQHPSPFDGEDMRTSIRVQPPLSIPRWTFFTGVFNYPWRTDARLRWIYLTIGFIALGELAAVILWTWDAGYTMAIAFFGLPIIWISIWTFSYAASCWSAILEDTAAGNDEVHNWPEVDYRDWIAKMLGLGLLAILCVFPSWGAGLLVQEIVDPGWYWPVFGGLLFVLYPIILLSSLECGSLLIPWSPPVLRSLLKLWRGWLIYYLLSAGLAVVYLGLLSVGLNFGWSWLLFLLTAPILSAVVFIHGRLLGRLAWRGVVRPQQ
ncbi:MAG: hypothetical protein IID45_00835 [Planctomycetes bacterium]|nr:hypothetical protein [Planctomycetota bacterium]